MWGATGGAKAGRIVGGRSTRGGGSSAGREEREARFRKWGTGRNRKKFLQHYIIFYSGNDTCEALVR